MAALSIPRGVPPGPVGKAVGVPTPARGATPRRRRLWRLETAGGLRNSSCAATIFGISRTAGWLALTCFAGCASSPGLLGTEDEAVDASIDVLQQVDLLPGVDATPAAPTFTQVYSKVMDGTCTGSRCHGGGRVDPDLSSRKVAYASLVKEILPLCGGDTMASVVSPAKAQDSVLYRKLIGTSCGGTRMPPGALPLPKTSLNLVRDWINAGALDD